MPVLQQAPRPLQAEVSAAPHQRTPLEAAAFPTAVLALHRCTLSAVALAASMAVVLAAEASMVAALVEAASTVEEVDVARQRL